MSYLRNKISWEICITASRVFGINLCFIAYVIKG